MSSYWSAHYGTALVLREDEFQHFLKTYTELRNPEETFTQEYADQLFEDCPIQEYDFIRSHIEKEPQGLTDCFNITPVLESETDGPWFMPFVRYNGDWNLVDGIKYTTLESDTTRGINLYVVFADFSMDNPLRWINNPYPTYESLVNEFKQKLERYLPKDFNWNSHIGRFAYAAYA